MVLSVQIAGELTKYGADFTVGAIVAIGIGRELGPVLCGVVLAGRVGAAITAEIGTMRVTEQIDALRCMAVSPIGYLVVPRLIACMCMLPLLDVFGVAIGVGGGMMVASLSHGVSSYVFMHSIHVYCVPSDLYIGVFKSVIFGMIVALVGCDRGMTCMAGAEGVGKATTQSVVYSIIMLLQPIIFFRPFFSERPYDFYQTCIPDFRQPADFKGCESHCQGRGDHGHPGRFGVRKIHSAETDHRAFKAHIRGSDGEREGYGPLK